MLLSWSWAVGRNSLPKKRGNQRKTPIEATARPAATTAQLRRDWRERLAVAVPYDVHPKGGPILELMAEHRGEAVVAPRRHKGCQGSRESHEQRRRHRRQLSTSVRRRNASVGGRFTTRKGHDLHQASQRSTRGRATHIHDEANGEPEVGIFGRGEIKSQQESWSFSKHSQPQSRRRAFLAWTTGRGACCTK